MTEREWLNRLREMERDQRAHYQAGREREGDALGELIRAWVCDGRGRGFTVPDGRPLPAAR